MKKNLYFFQFTFRYGEEISIPYSCGILWAYAKTFKDIEKNYENKGFIFLRDDPSKIVSSLDNPEIAAFSSYIWNWEINLEVAKRIKKKFPKCLIIFGGHQIPDNPDGFFDKYSFIDILVHGEGEITFSEILKEHLGRNNYSSIEGLTFKGDIKPWIKRTPVENLDIFPSPYLTGVFDELLKLPYNFHPVWETNRGCPYCCAFCDWGFKVFRRLRLFGEYRLYREIEWFSKNKILFMYGGDANFGLLPRDIKLAEKLTEVKARTGYPKKFRVSFDKNSNERILKIAKILNTEKLDKGVSLSMQSMDARTLDLIGRKNIDIDSLSGLAQKYQKEGISIFTELILGLPGETYDSFRKGVNEILNARFHDSLLIYLCILLRNTRLDNTKFKKEHGIQSVKTPIILSHSVPGSDSIQEYCEIIVGTKYMPTEDWKKACIFSWIIQCCHALNLTQVIAIYLKVIEGLDYKDFYEELLSFAEKNPDTVIGKELSFIKDKTEKVLTGDGWDTVLDEFSDISWTAEEASYLRISKDFDQFFLEIMHFLEGFKISGRIIEDLIRYQRAIIVKCDEDGSKEFELSCSLHDFYKNHLIGKDVKLKNGKYKIKVIDDLKFNGNKKEYAEKTVWFGRKGGKFIYQKIYDKKR